MDQFNQFLSGLDRKQIIRWTAIYLVIYVVINFCAGIAFGILGALSAATGALTAASGVATTTSSSSLFVIGGTSLILGLLYLISVPVCGIAAFELSRRKAWARNGAVIALGFTVLISLFGLTNSFSNILWAIISAFALYLFWSDAGIKQELSQ